MSQVCSEHGPKRGPIASDPRWRCLRHRALAAREHRELIAAKELRDQSHRWWERQLHLSRAWLALWGKLTPAERLGVQAGRMPDMVGDRLAPVPGQYELMFMTREHWVHPDLADDPKFEHPNMSTPIYKGRMFLVVPQDFSAFLRGAA